MLPSPIAVALVLLAVLPTPIAVALVLLAVADKPSATEFWPDADDQ